MRGIYIFGKIFGALFGSLIAGPIGFLMGLGIGHLFDKGLKLNAHFLTPDVALIQQVFFKTTFMVMGYIAKADGHVSAKEIQMARNVMLQLQLSQAQKMEAIEYFNRGKAPQFNFDAIMENFIHNCRFKPSLIQLFVEIQLRAAFVDGIANSYKRHILEHMCDKLNIPRSVLSRMESQFYAEESFQAPQQPAQNELSNAYGVLGLTKTASHQQVKKAYRQQMSLHHPDKLVAKGLPEAMIKLATEKTQRIQKAYEVICKSSGMK